MEPRKDATQNAAHRTYLRVKTAAQVYDIHPSTLYRLISAGAIRSVRIGHSVRIPASALDEYNRQLEAQ
ncbi:MAG: helix-turn-helix domain-containing protein [Bryobacterales bacterium]|nr:helix-turn-helix domain-containing protein [Bryobacterales bacterium]